MTALSADFSEIEERGRDGFGPLFEGTRGGQRMRIRLLAGAAASSSDAAGCAARLVHPAVYRVERGQADDMVWLASPVEGIPLAALPAEGEEATWPPVQCIELLLGLLDVVIAAVRADVALGPLLPCNVYVDAARPGWLRVFPLNQTVWRSADWLAHPPEQLMFVDRQTLRERPSATSPLFSLAALGLLVLRGRGALPSVADTSAADLVVRAIEQQHPLVDHLERSGPLEALLSEALAGSIATAGGFRARLLALKATHDPVARAQQLRDARKPLDATALLHRAIKDGTRTARIYLFKAQLECEQGHFARAIQSLREARVHAPYSRSVLEHLAELTGDPAEALDALRVAVRLDPLDPDLRMTLVEMSARGGDIRAALEHLAVVRAFAVAEPCARQLWTRIARFSLSCGRVEAALAIAEAHAGEDVESEVRCAALEVLGRARYARQEFEPAAHALREALRVLASISKRPSTGLLNELAFALTAIGAEREAIAAATHSLMIDPAQPRIVQFLAAVTS